MDLLDKIAWQNVAKNHLGLCQKSSKITTFMLMDVWLDKFMSKKINVLMMAAGTGGHVFPALAVADEMVARGAVIHWLGTPKGM